MKRIIRIAKLELSTLFYSPIAWLLLIVFFIQCASFYVNVLQQNLFLLQAGPMRRSLSFLTERIFGNPAGLVPYMAESIHLYLPLITMGLISREINSGTIKLLYSSPVTVADIVLGKFLAVVGYCLLLAAIFGLFMGLGVFHIPNIDTGLLWALLLAQFLLFLTYAAIGLFVSCLTAYQVAAAIGTFVIFAFLGYVRNIWQNYDFFRDLTYALSFRGRIYTLSNGLINSKDLFYFLAIILIFLGLSILKLHFTRSREKAAVRFLKYAAVVAGGLMLAYCSSRPQWIWYADVTSTKKRTLSEASQKILKQMNEGPLEITSYFNLLDPSMSQGMPWRRNDDLDNWLDYIRFKPDLQLKYVYYYDSAYKDKKFYKQYPGQTLDQMAEKVTKSIQMDISRFKTPAEIHKIVDLKPEENRQVMVVKYKGRSTFLRVYPNDMPYFPTETEIGAALKRLIAQPPKIAFLQGHYERSLYKTGDEHYKTLTSNINFKNAMVNQGFDFIELSLDSSAVPADVSAIVIADPRADFDQPTLQKLEQYIAAGGNLLIAGEPGKQTVLNPLLNKLGLRMTAGMLVQPSENFKSSFVFPYLTKDALQFTTNLTASVQDSMKISMPGAAGLVYSGTTGFTVHYPLATDPVHAWRKALPLSDDSTEVRFMPGEGDEKGTFLPMVSLSRRMSNGKEQRIIISGDADFMSNGELAKPRAETRNFQLSTSIFGWLSNGEFPIRVSYAPSKDTSINLDMDSVDPLRLGLVWVVPALILISGTVLLMRRKRK